MTSKRSSLPTLGPERRYVALDEVEIRSEEDDRIVFTGHAAVFGVRTWIGPRKWGFWEVIRAGAFAKTIAEADVRMLKNHDANFELARSIITKGPGSLRLAEDKSGLRDDAEWIPTTYAKDLAISVRAGVISQQSFGFLPVKEEWSQDDDSGEDVRELVEVQLFDVSPVTFPAYTETDASMRAAQMGLLLEAADLPDTDTSLLVRALRTGTVTPDLATTLRAAGEALAELALRTQPAPATGDGDEGIDEDMRTRAAEIRQAQRTLAVTHSTIATGGTRP